jgi:hypothetical protein
VQLEAHNQFHDDVSEHAFLEALQLKSRETRDIEHKNWWVAVPKLDISSTTCSSLWNFEKFQRLEFVVGRKLLHILIRTLMEN